MIETLNGICETVHYVQNSTIKLYNNDEYEDYPPHWHPVIEIIIPLENDYTLHFGNDSVHLNEGELIIICPGVIHAITAPLTGKRIIFQCNTANLHFLKDMDNLITELSPYIIINKKDYPEIMQEAANYMLEIRDLYNQQTLYSETLIYSKLMELLCLIGQHRISARDSYGTIKTKNQDGNISAFLSLCDYINQHCSEDLKLEDIAQKSGFSKFYFTRLFKQYTGETFYKYVNIKRIAKAEQLLVEPENTVTDVALSCGFQSLSSFIRMFKQIKGCTPTEFKNMYWRMF